MYTMQIENTLFFCSHKLGYTSEVEFRGKHIPANGLPCGWINSTWRKSTEGHKGYDHAVERAIKLQAFLLLPEYRASKQYGSMLAMIKNNTYRIRYDLDRDLDSIVRYPALHNRFVTPVQAWDLVMNGKGVSQTTGKKLFPIVCREKIRKIAIAYSNALQEFAEKHCYACTAGLYDGNHYNCPRCRGMY